MDISDKMFTFMVLLIFVLCLCGLSAAYSNCGGVFTESVFSIESPNYPDRFHGNITCEFLLKDEKCSTEFIFNFVDFYVDDTANCNSSSFEVEEQDILCGKQSGTRIYYSQYGTLKVAFNSQQHQVNAKFKIIVSKVPCNSNRVSRHTKRSLFHPFCKSYEIPSPFSYSSAVQELSPRYYHNPVQLPLIGQQNTAETFCCADRYDAKNFIITSPNFSHTKDSPINCVYHIYRANKNICRIRFNFLFYWNGLQSDYWCQYGHIEIDGKQICGCRIGLKLASNFDQRYDNSPKRIKFYNGGYPAGKFSGFAIEVFQDECLVKQTQLNSASSYRQFESTNEDTNYVDISTLNQFYPNGFNDNACKVWGVLQKGLLEKHVLWKKIPECINTKPGRCLEIRHTSGCLKSPGYPFYYPNNLNLCYRFIKSPGYCAVKLVMMDFLIQKSHQCTSDYVLLGNKERYCGDRLFNTFSWLTFLNGTYEDLLFVTDSSISCRGFKAWFEQIPCKYSTTTTPSTTATTITTRTPTITTTTSTTTELTIPTTPPIIATTTTERSTTLRPTNPAPSTTVPTTTSEITLPPTSTIPYTPAPISTTTELPPTTIITQTPQQCLREYSEERFQIVFYGYEDNVCRFTIHKYHPDVCLLNLRFIVFDFRCEEEYLIINGNRFCQPINSTSLDFDTDSMTIYYYRASVSNALNLRMNIYGMQDTNCLPDPEGVPEKLQEYETVVTENESGNVSVTIWNLNPDMCGLIIKPTWYARRNYSITTNMCNLLIHYEDRKNCLPLEDYSLYALYTDGKIELIVPSKEVFDSMRFKEVRCVDRDIHRIDTSEI